MVPIREIINLISFLMICDTKFKLPPLSLKIFEHNKLFLPDDGRKQDPI